MRAVDKVRLEKMLVSSRRIHRVIRALLTAGMLGVLRGAQAIHEDGLGLFEIFASAGNLKIWLPLVDAFRTVPL